MSVLTNVRSEIELNADGTWKSIKKSEKQAFVSGAISALTAKFQDDVATKGAATLFVDGALFLAGAYTADYMQNKKLRLNPFTPFVPAL